MLQRLVEVGGKCIPRKHVLEAHAQYPEELSEGFLRKVVCKVPFQ